MVAGPRHAQHSGQIALLRVDQMLRTPLGSGRVPGWRILAWSKIGRDVVSAIVAIAGEPYVAIAGQIGDSALAAAPKQPRNRLECWYRIPVPPCRLAIHIVVQMKDQARGRTFGLEPALHRAQCPTPGGRSDWAPSPIPG